MSKQPLLIEIGTEELPPKSLNTLAQAFADQVTKQLTQAEIAYGDVQVYFAPRRMALLIDQVAAETPAKTVVKRGPAVQAAYDQEGNPTKALQGFARSCGAALADIERLETDKGSWVVFHESQPAQQLATLLPEMVAFALKNLPIPKMMRWGDHATAFVRPVHWLVMMHGDAVVPATLFGLQTSNHTYGHRFHHPQAIALAHASEYLTALAETGYVMADFERRVALIREQVAQVTQDIAGEALLDPALLQEVANIVEWPVALLCPFDQAFLEVPKEALVSAMQGHQKCFPIQDKAGVLLPYFVTVSNIASKRPQSVIDGNEKVMRARLSDAAFFFANDKKTPLETHLPALEKVTFQKQLGSLGEKSQRISAIAGYLAGEWGVDVEQARHAGLLCKTDLITDMVGEFPELQGIMGQYYALHHGESAEVAAAMAEHYQPRFANDAIPANQLSCVVALADKLDTLVGIFGIGQMPTGSKDPFALRRAAIGILRILTESKQALSLPDAIAFVVAQYGDKLIQVDTQQAVLAFITERMKNHLQEQGVAAGEIESVLSASFTDVYDATQRILAVQHFAALPEAHSLVESNKRVRNLLEKNQALSTSLTIHPERLQDQYEKALYDAAQAASTTVEPLLTEQRYQEVLTHLAQLNTVIDAFFQHVMVMDKDPLLQENRLALLQFIRHLFIQVADIAYLN